MKIVEKENVKKTTPCIWRCSVIYVKGSRRRVCSKAGEQKTTNKKGVIMGDQSMDQSSDS